MPDPGCWQVVPIIHIPGLGDRAAETLCLERKIASQHDAEKLKEAKDLAYLKGFNEGVINVGPHKGSKVPKSGSVAGLSCPLPSVLHACMRCI